LRKLESDLRRRSKIWKIRILMLKKRKKEEIDENTVIGMRVVKI
jgi:hypothetical protein